MGENKGFDLTSVTIRSTPDQTKYVDWEITVTGMDADLAVEQAITGAEKLRKIR